MQLADFLYWAEGYFIANKLIFGHGTNNAWDEAVAIARYVLHLSPNVSRDVLARDLLDSEKEELVNLANRRVTECIPVPYLTHEAWFCGEKYYVDERVIIPRSPFAELVNNKFNQWIGQREIYNILDLCTGSGCIAIACAKAFPLAEVDAVDISRDALEVVNYNIQAHNVKDRVHAIYSDLFQNLTEKKYDIIVSNPPYVSAKEHYCLPHEYQHEPKLALVSGDDGLDCTKEILKNAHKFLKPKGLLFVEVGNSWHALVKQYPNISFQWLTLKHGGEGIFILRRDQLGEE
jgi:ribosomal protein L3 glutamine methyltransferase